MTYYTAFVAAIGGKIIVYRVKPSHRKKSIVKAAKKALCNAHLLITCHNNKEEQIVRMLQSIDPGSLPKGRWAVM